MYAQILPQMEMQTSYDSFNFSLPPDTPSPANTTGNATVINVLLCPSDYAPNPTTIGNFAFATHNYNMNAGSGYAVVAAPARRR